MRLRARWFARRSMNDLFSTRAKTLVGDRLQERVPLAAHTHFKVGGPARWFVDAMSGEELVKLIRLARETKTPWVVLGGGTNVLVSDAGFDGVVIKTGFRAIMIEKNGRVVAEAGALSSALARQTAEAGLTGLEWAISLPGTVGGAVRGNAGCFGGEVKDHLVSIATYDPEMDREIMVSAAACEMTYRESIFKRQPWIILSVALQCASAPAAETRARLEEVLKCRLESQPKNEKCAGCAFKNVSFADSSALDKLKTRVAEIPVRFFDHGHVPAGWLLDQLALKGTRVGGAEVSAHHANFIVNDGTATASDIVQLLSVLKTRVYDETGLHLQEEVQLIGF